MQRSDITTEGTATYCPEDNKRADLKARVIAADQHEQQAYEWYRFAQKVKRQMNPPAGKIADAMDAHIETRRQDWKIALYHVGALMREYRAST